MNSTIERTPGQQRKHKAEAALAQLKTEHAEISNRQKTAQETIGRLDHEIVAAQRSGDSDLLARLRSDRRDAEETIRELSLALPKVAREIELAEGESLMANRQCLSEQYNAIQLEQARLLSTISASVSALLTAVHEKVRLAEKQDGIVANVRPYGNLSPEGIRHELAYSITALLLEGRAPKAFHEIDWSTWRMTEQGDLLH